MCNLLANDLEVRFCAYFNPPNTLGENDGVFELFADEKQQAEWFEEFIKSTYIPLETFKSRLAQHQKRFEECNIFLISQMKVIENDQF